MLSYIFMWDRWGNTPVPSTDRLPLHCIHVHHTWRRKSWHDRNSFSENGTKSLLYHLTQVNPQYLFPHMPCVLGMFWSSAVGKYNCRVSTIRSELWLGAYIIPGAYTIGLVDINWRLQFLCWENRKSNAILFSSLLDPLLLPTRTHATPWWPRS